MSDDNVLTWSGPAGVPDATTVLRGDRVRLEPLNARAHGDDLYAAARDDRDPLLWKYLVYGPWEDDRAGFDAHLAGQEASSDPRFYAVVLDDGRAVGVVSYLRIEPAHGVIEIGHIWFGPALQRTPAATELVYLLARHAFDELGHRRLEWKCDAANARSQAAARRFGFTFEGIFRQHQIVKGRNRDTAWFSILDGEWPAVRAGFEAWLAPENFDADGRQHAGLAELRSAVVTRM
ncbi:acetyltransferase [Baekduia alba]|uniref:GNAT family N-acetyltransferase n=1 Tax=Baekduia alba TaxID=2997333 RepID=UPI00233F870B|nr:GNAT family protein [Baekduia alba]WCB96882.1 acetyltransferase [Baekduia alba]